MSSQISRWAATSCLAAALLGASAVFAASALAQTAAAPSLEQVFRAEPYRGENAKEPRFSRSGRYLAYLWNPFGEPGTDLYVHDSKTGKTQRVTSQAVMAAFDAPEDLERFDRKLKQKRDETAERQAKEEAQQAYLAGKPVDLSQWEMAAIERVKQEIADKKRRDDAQKAADKAEAELEKKAAEMLAAKRAGKPLAEKAAAVAEAASAASTAASAAEKAGKDKELWELRDELKKTLTENKLKPTDLYPGVTQIVWAQQRDELIFQYRGGLYRWVAAEAGKIQPLQTTQRELKIVAYTADDQGYVFTDETRVLRARFAAGGVQILNRELIHPDDAEKQVQDRSHRHQRGRPLDVPAGPRAAESAGRRRQAGAAFDGAPSRDHELQRALRDGQEGAARGVGRQAHAAAAGALHPPGAAPPTSHRASSPRRCSRRRAATPGSS